MADSFDPYREALVVKTNTIWPDEYDTLDPAERVRIESQLQSQPQTAGNLEYVRIHSGFCRQITVTSDDVARLRG